jgi:hypothetical protein
MLDCCQEDDIRLSDLNGGQIQNPQSAEENIAVFVGELGLNQQNGIACTLHTFYAWWMQPTTRSFAYVATCL